REGGGADAVHTINGSPHEQVAAVEYQPHGFGVAKAHFTAEKLAPRQLPFILHQLLDLPQQAVALPFDTVCPAHRVFEPERVEFRARDRARTVRPLLETALTAADGPASFVEEALRGAVKQRAVVNRRDHVGRWA